MPAPRRLATVEYGPWVALATTWAAGATGGRWTDASITAVARACRTASGHRAPDALPLVAERIFDFDGGRLLEIGAGDDWEVAHARPAADVVAGWERWTAGDALVHRDIRLDNTAVDTEGRSAVLLDWAYAAAGAPWIDLAHLAADVVATGHALGQQAATDRAYRLLRMLPPEASRFVVGLAGMWCIRAATIPDTVMPSISTWRRARSAALRPLVTPPDRRLSRPDPSTHRLAVVVPLASEYAVRHDDLVARQRAAVRDASGGRLGYLHMPDMMARGWAESTGTCTPSSSGTA